MLDVRLKIGFIGILKRIINTKFPEQWNDLTFQMIGANANLLSFFFFSRVNKKDLQLFYDQTIDQRLFLIYSFIGIRFKLLFQLDTYQVNALLERTTFLLKEDKLLNRIILPSFKFKSKRYYGPSDRFNNLKFGEFIQADTYYLSYYETNDVRFIYLLIACIYRPSKIKVDNNSPDFDGDIRELFNQYHVKIRGDKFKKLPSTIRDTIFFNYSTIRKWLTEKYIYVFSEPSESNGTFKQNKKDSGWKSIIKNMASNVLDIDKYAEQSMHNVLDDLDTKILENLKK